MALALAAVQVQRVRDAVQVRERQVQVWAVAPRVQVYRAQAVERQGRVYQVQAVERQGRVLGAAARA